MHIQQWKNGKQSKKKSECQESKQIKQRIPVGNWKLTGWGGLGGERIYGRCQPKQARSTQVSLCTSSYWGEVKQKTKESSCTWRRGTVPGGDRARFPTVKYQTVLTVCLQASAETFMIFSALRDNGSSYILPLRTVGYKPRNETTTKKSLSHAARRASSCLLLLSCAYTWSQNQVDGKKV